MKQLARETQNTVDGPFAARLTGYGKKPIYHHDTNIRDHLLIAVRPSDNTLILDQGLFGNPKLSLHENTKILKMV